VIGRRWAPFVGAAVLAVCLGWRPLAAQMPPPLPPADTYRERDVRYPSGDLTLAATMFLPAGGGRHAARPPATGAENTYAPPSTRRPRETSCYYAY
jgi:hypothetical protein